MVPTMNKTLFALRALFSALLLGVGLSAYAGRLDPMSRHIGQPRSTVSGDVNPADACALPCVPPH
jgi:hypothetical protein